MLWIADFSDDKISDYRGPSVTTYRCIVFGNLSTRVISTFTVFVANSTLIYLPSKLRNKEKEEIRKSPSSFRGC